MALLESRVLDGIEPGLTVGLRAEHVSIVAKGKGRLTCTVTEAEFLGSETLIGLDHDGAVGLTVQRPGLAMAPVGQKIDISFKDQDLHKFDQAGERIAGH
jgi:sn-glycerol 3-phosphate transport system ATP-binding protein